MSSFTCQAYPVRLSAHPNADRIELAQVHDYLSIVLKGEYQEGDLAIYIPEAAIVPDEIMIELGLFERDDDAPVFDDDGRHAFLLAGPQHNRVKAKRLRGILSQGLLYKPSFPLEQDIDYSDQLGITKWIPPVPIHFAGQLTPAPGIQGYTDIENIKRYPDTLQEGEEVYASEKIHGTCSLFLFDCVSDELYVGSKGFASRGLALVDTLDEKGNSTNVYWRAAKLANVEENLRALAAGRFIGAERIMLYGETFGVQDLRYGLENGAVDLRVFDMAVDGEYLDIDDLLAVAEDAGFAVVPQLYRGPYSKALLTELSEGKEQVTGREVSIREGLVVRPVHERAELELGRVILKFVSERYLTRKGDTTEYE